MRASPTRYAPGMTEVAQRYATVADAFGARISGIAPDGWHAPTPCSEWTARDLVAHVIGTQRRMIATLDGTEPAEVDPGDDLPRLWRAASDAVADALTDEHRAATVVSGMFGEQPFESLVGRLACADTLIHTWDLARATGQDERLDPYAVAKAMEFLAPIDEGMRRPGGFTAKIEPPADADEQTKLLNFCGRAA
ncbi:MAG: TIGR03086 family protein [Pseudonocardiaceae bacterium]|nr:TIGR03086 family protein [Pseudonocardiaceae bacterium]